MDIALLSRPVSDLLRSTADAVIRPRFRHLADGDVTEKSAGELVTVADREAEALISAELRRLAPGCPIVGEEAAADDPTLVTIVSAASRCWLVDPLDGTGNFVEGSPDYAVMVTLVEEGEPVGAWIWQPEHDRMWVAVRGQGTRCNGELVRTRVGVPLPSMRIGVLSRFLDEPTKATVHAGRLRFGVVEEGPHCAGITYPRLVEGHYDAVLFWRTLPWDHAPGALLLTEAGGSAHRVDGSPYVAGDEGVGLLATSDAGSWREVRDALLGGDPTVERP